MRTPSPHRVCQHIAGDPADPVAPFCGCPTIIHAGLRTSWCATHFLAVFRVNMERRTAGIDKATMKFVEWAETVQRRVDTDGANLGRPGDNRSVANLTPERLLALSADGSRRDYGADTTPGGGTEPPG